MKKIYIVLAAIIFAGLMYITDIVKKEHTQTIKVILVQK